MIMGDTCTRACAFCDVKTGKPTSLDIFEPAKISKAVKKLNLKHVVITSVDRDDLEDGGANHFYRVVKTTREKNPNTSIEVLTPDFLRKGDAYKKVLEADLDVFNHNIETVPRLYTKVRPGARYFASLELLKNTKKYNNKVFTKSGIMVGLGENKEEIIENLTNKTQIMICGSTEMGKDVAKKIKEILKDSDGFTFENLEQNNQIKVDTY